MELKKLAKERSKHSYGKAFHGLGIFVNVRGDVGYRPLENPPPGVVPVFFKNFFGFVYISSIGANLVKVIVAEFHFWSTVVHFASLRR